MSKRALHAATVALGLLIAIPWQACAVYEPSLLIAAPLDVSDAAPRDADASEASARWPAPPVGDDGGPGTPGTVVAALRMLDMSGGAPVGFDLDGVATCPGPDSCRTAPGVSPHCDGAHGRDNAGGELLATLGAFGVFDATEVSRGLQAGAFGVVFALRDYNGGSNDARVTLALYISNGVDAPTDAGPRLPPKFDGTDRWTVEPGSLLGGVTSVGTDCGASARACAPLYFDDNAYVTGNVLVAKLDFPLSLGGGAITLDLTGSIVTARLVKQGATVRFEDGQIAGRWSTAKLLSSLSVLADPLNGNVPLCGENPTYQGLKKKICAAADISVDARRDGTDGPCDALSIAFGFRAEAAHLGTVTQSAAPRGGCGDGGAPYKDSCP